MNFIDTIKERAKKDIKKIVLPEASDLRILKAAEMAVKSAYANIVLIGNKENINKMAKENNLDISKTTIIDPQISEKSEIYANSLYELRKEKGMTLEKARELVKDEVYFGMMMVKLNEADGLVSGAIHSTSDTLRPALQILKTAPGTKLVSAFFLMVVPNCEYGENGVFVFGDCGLNQNPSAEELVEIANSSSKSFEQLVGKPANVAMLSYSTKGSAKSDLTQKVIDATNMIKEKYPDIILVSNTHTEEKELPTEIVDEHLYSTAEAFMTAGEKYRYYDHASDGTIIDASVLNIHFSFCYTDRSLNGSWRPGFKQ